MQNAGNYNYAFGTATKKGEDIKKKAYKFQSGGNPDAAAGLNQNSTRTTKKGSGGGSGAAVGVLGAAAEIGGNAIDNAQPRNAGNGFNYQPVGLSAAKGALKGAAAGASIGSVVPGIGTAVGAVVGAVVGGVSSAIKGAKLKKEAIDGNKKFIAANVEQQNQIGADIYGGLQKKSLMTNGTSAPTLSKNGGNLPPWMFKKGGILTKKGMKSNSKPKLSKYEDGGSISQMGYKDVSPYRDAKMLNIHTPSGLITMNGVSKTLVGFGNNGESKMMGANSGYHQFQSNIVTEIPREHLSKMIIEECTDGCDIEKFNVNGVTPVNIIARGVLHKEKNKIGSKGLPVVNHKEKVAEIERDELVMTKELTDIVEEISSNDDNDESTMVLLGKVLKDQLLNHTL